MTATSITPGPGLYHQFWMRDAAYMLDALAACGYGRQAWQVLLSFPPARRRMGASPGRAGRAMRPARRSGLSTGWPAWRPTGRCSRGSGRACGAGPGGSCRCARGHARRRRRGCSPRAAAPTTSAPPITTSGTISGRWPGWRRRRPWPRGSVCPPRHTPGRARQRPCAQRSTTAWRVRCYPPAQSPPRPVAGSIAR